MPAFYRLPARGATGAAPAPNRFRRADSRSAPAMPKPSRRGKPWAFARPYRHACRRGRNRPGARLRCAASPGLRQRPAAFRLDRVAVQRSSTAQAGQARRVGQRRRFPPGRYRTCSAPGLKFGPFPAAMASAPSSPMGLPTAKASAPCESWATSPSACRPLAVDLQLPSEMSGNRLVGQRGAV